MKISIEISEQDLEALGRVIDRSDAVTPEAVKQQYTATCILSRMRGAMSRVEETKKFVDSVVERIDAKRKNSLPE